MRWKMAVEEPIHRQAPRVGRVMEVPRDLEVQIPPESESIRGEG